MNALTVVTTDLLPPLGAYLRLRERGRASFLLESVEHGRLGRHSFVGAGSRIVDFAEAESLARTVPIVGYLGYDHAAQLEPTVQLPDLGPDLPESRFVVAETLVRFDHALELYRSLRRVNPSPYLFLLELDGLALVGSSPETLVKAEGRSASLNPIAGTTRPGEGDAERLLSSEKDRAEHVMLVDL